LLELYQTTLEERWFVEARRFADIVLEHFPAQDGGFYDTSDDHERLIVRPRSLEDNATPSGNSMMAKQLLRLAAYTGDARYDEAARKTLGLLVEALRQVPQAFGEALNAADMLANGLDEVAVVGSPADEHTQELLRVIHVPFRPNIITALAAQNVEADHLIPLLSYRTMRNGQPTVYICRNFTCQMPVVTTDEVLRLLDKPG
ncbi:MAG: thioredoxin domain-containing protein, partial [Anaerolineae bacterium]|nr:thioredoxin domain-containing protein [Anaerolineae bacterium]